MIKNKKSHCSNIFAGTQTYFDNLSLLRKLLLIVSSNAILFAVLALAALSFSSKAYNEQLYKSTAANLTHSTSTISNSLRNLETLSYSIIASSEIQNSLINVSETYDTAVWSRSNRSITNALQTFSTMAKEDGADFLTISNDRFSYSTYTLWHNKISSDCLERALAGAAQKNGAVAWTAAEPGSNALILSRDVRKIDHMDLNRIGTLLIYVDLNQIIKNTSQVISEYDSSLYILRDGDTLLYSPMNIKEEELEHIISNSTSRYQICPIGGDNYFIVRNRMSSYGWDYYCLVPFDDVLSTLHSVVMWTAVVILVGVLLSFFISRHLIRSIIRQFDLLIEKMDRFSQNEESILNAELFSEKVARQDEIGKLYKHFGRMTLRIQHLVNTNYISEILNQKAQIKALESQINPHFLYNTLESINWRAKASNDRTISLMTESLGALLRATLSNKSSLVTLGYELELVHSYITIQTFRFDERLDYTQQVPEAFLHCLLPPLTLQPLVENAIYYGLEESVETCYISISARALPEHDGCPSRLEITVTNSGSHFDDNLLSLLKQGLRTPKRSGIGLLNIDQRIKLLFGDAYGLTLSNQDDTAIVTITIPYKTGEETTC